VSTIWNGDVKPETWYQASWDLKNYLGQPVSSNVYILYIIGPKYSRLTKLAVVRDG
jgi:hypothetical protein